MTAIMTAPADKNRHKRKTQEKDLIHAVSFIAVRTQSFYHKGFATDTILRTDDIWAEPMFIKNGLHFLYDKALYVRHTFYEIFMCHIKKKYLEIINGLFKTSYFTNMHI